MCSVARFISSLETELGPWGWSTLLRDIVAGVAWLCLFPGGARYAGSGTSGPTARLRVPERGVPVGILSTVRRGSTSCPQMLVLALIWWFLLVEWGVVGGVGLEPVAPADPLRGRPRPALERRSGPDRNLISTGDGCVECFHASARPTTPSSVPSSSYGHGVAAGPS